MNNNIPFEDLLIIDSDNISSKEHKNKSSIFVNPYNNTISYNCNGDNNQYLQFFLPEYFNIHRNYNFLDNDGLITAESNIKVFNRKKDISSDIHIYSELKNDVHTFLINMSTNIKINNPIHIVSMKLLYKPKLGLINKILNYFSRTSMQILYSNDFIKLSENNITNLLAKKNTRVLIYHPNNTESKFIELKIPKNYLISYNEYTYSYDNIFNLSIHANNNDYQYNNINIKIHNFSEISSNYIYTKYGFNQTRKIYGIIKAIICAIMIFLIRFEIKNKFIHMLITYSIYISLTSLLLLIIMFIINIIKKIYFLSSKQMNDNTPKTIITLNSLSINFAMNTVFWLTLLFLRNFNILEISDSIFGIACNQEMKYLRFIIPVLIEISFYFIGSLVIKNYNKKYLYDHIVMSIMIAIIIFTESNKQASGLGVYSVAGGLIILIIPMIIRNTLKIKKHKSNY